MELNSVALPLAYIGALLSVCMVLPQLTRTIRNPALAGVSPTSWALTSLACLGWLIYGFRADVLPQVPGNVLLIAGAVAVALLVPSAWSRPRRAVSLVTAAALIVSIAMLVSPPMVGYLAFGISLMAVWPQLAYSYGNWRTRVESGLSLTTWSIKIAATLCWLSYATITADLPVLIASSIGMITTLAIFAMETSARQASSRRDVEALAHA